MFAVFSGVFVLQRILYKLYAKIELGLDDWFTLLTAIFGVPSVVINTYGVVPNGIGRDAWTLTYSQLTNFGMFFYIMELNYILEVGLLKIAMLFFYIRIFPSQRVKRLLWATVAFVSLYTLSFLFAAAFQCQPVSHFWLKWDGTHPGKCVDINAIAWSNAAISISLDIWMLAIPMWQLRSLKLDWRKKIGVALMFGVGALYVYPRPCTQPADNLV